MGNEVLRVEASGEPVPFEIPGATGDFRIQILNEDEARGIVTSIVHLPAGGRIPAHYHEAGSEMHYVLEGDLTDGGREMGVGAFSTQAAGVVHGPQESRGGARVLTVQGWQSRDGRFDFHLAEGGAGGGDGPAEGAPAPRGGAAEGGDAAGSPRGAETQEQAAADREAGGYS